MEALEKLQVEIDGLKDAGEVSKTAFDTFCEETNEKSEESSKKQQDQETAIDDLKQEIPALEESLVMQCCPCSGPTPTISALFTDAPNSIDISEINTADVDLDQDYDETTTTETQSENFITTTEFDGLSNFLFF